MHEFIADELIAAECGKTSRLNLRCFIKLAVELAYINLTNQFCEVKLDLKSKIIVLESILNLI